MTGARLGPEEPIHLRETGQGVRCRLRTAQAETLKKYGKVVGVERLGEDDWRVTGKQRVGLVRLGHGRGTVDLRIEPKLKISKLMFLIGYASGDPWWEEEADWSWGSGLETAMAGVYARSVRRSLNGGVLHGYRAVEEDLPFVRGRVRTTDQARRTGLPLPVAVAYDDFTADIAENRILLTALHRLERLPDVPWRLRSALRHLVDRLPNVTPLRTGTPLPPWTPTRFNARYVPALRLAEQVLTDRSLSPDYGATAPPLVGSGILLDLSAVFEHFLGHALRETTKPHGIKCRMQETHHLDTRGRLRMNPDVLCYRGGHPLAAVDAKYKILGETPKREDIYQMVGYCVALGVRQAHLVHATAGNGGVPRPYEIRQAGITIDVRALDLSRRPAEILREVSRLAEHIASSPARRGS
ncbi:McrC family protein [Streptomyces sp. HK10]|uniref:McrC family protein n=1 Tax=Streptomyces sp. HK10 TaxID=3373255 RepID=UPI00374A1CC1